MKPPITVSVVEDHAPTREKIARLLRADPGFRCVSAHAAADEAVRDIPRHRPRVVLMDIVFAGNDGVDCTRRLKQLLPDVRILMLTVYDDAERLFASLAAGADGYLLKRTPPARILQAIRDVLDGGAPMTGTIARKVLQYFHKLAVPADAPEFQTLTPREHEVLQQLSFGHSNQEIATALDITPDTVRVHLRRVFTKLHVSSRTAALAKLVRR